MFTQMRSAVEAYDQLASRYERLHQRWLRHAGGEAQAALEALVRALAAPGKQLLDAGCGTGNLARSLISEGMSPATLTLLDPSQQMLARCSDIPVSKVKGRLEALPFTDNAFDIVTCVWALETTTNPDVALKELCRVVRPGGVLCLVFCSDRPVRGLTDGLMRQAVLRRGTGRFLSRERVINAIEGVDGFSVRTIPNNGPAATLLAKRSVSADPVGLDRLPRTHPMLKADEPRSPASGAVRNDWPANRRLPHRLDRKARS